MSSYEIVGIDVAARTLKAIGEQVRLSSEYKNSVAGRKALVAALARSKRPVRVVLEATGIYFLDVACDLVAAGIEVMVLNPKASHHFAEAMMQRRKDDPVDAAMLGEYGRRMDFVPWTPPAPKLLALRAIAREIGALGKAITAAKNRRHAVKATLLGAAVVRRALERQVAMNEKLVKALLAEAVKQIKTDAELKRLFELTDSIPGFAAKSVVGVMAELVVLPPMKARQWVAQAGLDVREETSGSSVRRKPRISKRGNKRLRVALHHPAMTAARCCPEAKAFCDRLIARGKTPLQATVALMRKLLHAIHAMWRNNEEFNAEKLFAPASAAPTHVHPFVRSRATIPSSRPAARTSSARSGGQGGPKAPAEGGAQRP
jgi:transposase